MSTYLWRYYLDNDLEKFKQLLATANYSNTAPKPSYAGSLTTGGAESPGKPGTSPLARVKGKGTKGGRNSTTITLTRADINSKDSHGVTLLHLIASSTAEDAIEFGLALLEVSFLDPYVQDHESGWTALHRALYTGNIALARAIMDRDIKDLQGSGPVGAGGGLIKIKDHEGNSPFDVYATTIASRVIPHGNRQAAIAAGDSESDDDDEVTGDNGNNTERHNQSDGYAYVDGDELFAFGSNKNLTLGFGDEDDRQFPERVHLKRPQYLQDLYHREHISQLSRKPLSPDDDNADTSSLGDLPAVVDFRPTKIQDVQLSKLHSAILTTDPVSNLFICGYGNGGRLGTGDESTRFNFTNVSGGGLQKKKIVSVALGQNHSLAVTSDGEVYTWGSNMYGQLGYAVATQGPQDEDPKQLWPRQLFGLLKRERVAGCAASRTHSVLFTESSLYTFGKHDGQLGLIDSDARSLEMQVTPRKVAASLFSSRVSMVTAIDKATGCLLENHDVWIFANYGYAKITFPLDGFSNYFLRGSFSATHYDRPNYISKICSGGDTICALAREGDVYTVNVSQKIDPSAGSSSTTNPTKVRAGLSTPQRIWSLRKEHMAVRDVSVGQDGSVIICTNAGSVWRRVKRAKIKDANAVAGSSEHKPKDYKFSRIPGLTRITAVRSNAYGAFAAIRRDCDVLQTQIEVSPETLWQDVFPLLPFHGLALRGNAEDSDTENPEPRLWKPHTTPASPATVRHAILTSKDIEADLAPLLEIASRSDDLGFDIGLGCTNSDLRIPCHQFLLMARSTVMRKTLLHFRQSYYAEIPDVLLIEYDKEGKPLVMLQGVDVLTLINFALYLYSDTIVSFWNHTRQAPKLAFRYREARVEAMKLAGALEMRNMEHAARLMSEPPQTMNKNFDLAVLDTEFLDSGDIEVELIDGSIKVHSALICRRCPFFEGLFHGRAGGGWLSSRRVAQEEEHEPVKVDLQHVSTVCFMLILRHLYADAGEEIFELSTAPDLDAFLDIVLDVLAVANELMIDRLAQICQKIIGSYVNTRNVCWLLNAVAPCSVTEFKDAALEYICLNLEGMLENHFLDELDEDLMIELDHIVRDNQLALLPIAKSGLAEADLIERYPELVDIMEKNKQTKIDSMTLRSRYHEDEAKMAKLAAKSPSLRAKAPQSDMMFDMDEDKFDIGPHAETPKTPPSRSQGRVDSVFLQSPPTSLPREQIWFDAKGRQLSPRSASIQGRVLSKLGEPTSTVLDEDEESVASTGPLTRRTSEAGPWADSSLPTAKLSMKQIMAQASEGQGRRSSIAAGMAKSGSPAASLPSAVHRPSQKERKRLQQQQLQNALNEAQGTLDASPSSSKASPWQTPVQGRKVSLKEDLLSAAESSLSPSAPRRRPSPSSSLTMRQTVPGNVPNAKQEQPIRKVSPVTTTKPLQQRSVSTPSTSNPLLSQPSKSPLRPSPQPRQSQPTTATQSTNATSSSPIVPRSIRHNTGRAAVEPSLQISINDILTQQQIEKDLIKEATAKRNLQEIQEEQAFQEWWNKEEAATRARMEAEEAAAKGLSGRRGDRGGGGRSGRGKGKGRGGGNVDGGPNGGTSKTATPATVLHNSSSRGGKDPPRGGRGRSRGRGGAEASLAGSSSRGKGV